MAVEPLHLLTDEPIRHYRDDGLGLRQYADVIAGAALGTPGPFTIGVFGDWGQGKTSLLRSAMSLVDDAGRDDVVTVWFNAWRHERDEEPIVPLIGTIVAALDAGEGKPGFRSRLGNALKALAYGLSFRLNLGAVQLGASGKDMVNREEELDARAAGSFVEQSLYLDAYEALAKLTQQEGDEPPLKIVVFIDDLDRCLPDRGLRLLEGLKLVLAQPGFVFVLAVDREVVQSYLAKRYEDEFGVDNAQDRSARYLYKIVQLPLGLPSHEGRFDEFIQHLRSHEALAGDGNPVAAAFEELRDVLGAGTHYNPRALVRLVNNLIVDQHTWVDNQGDAEGLLGLTAVARILRDQLGGLYRVLVADKELCGALADPGSGFSDAIREKFGSEDASGHQAQLRTRIAERLEQAGLGRLLATAAGQAWLTNHAARRQFDQFLIVVAPVEASEPLSAEHLVIASANRQLGRDADTPLSPTDNEYVTALSFIEPAVSDEAVPLIAQFPNLTRLTLFGRAITDAGAAHLARLTNLEFLVLDRTSLTDASMPHLSTLKFLTTLSLSGAQITDAGLEALTELPRLTTLWMNETLITDAAAPILAAISSLRAVTLSGTPMTSNGISKLKRLRPELVIRD